jgi:hypothetical protein
MYEFVVDQGTLHTIPLFFLISGYVAAAAGIGRIRRVIGKAIRGMDGGGGASDADAGGENTDNADVDSLSQKVAEPSFLKMCGRRVCRLMLPWLFGTICAIIPRQLIQGEFDVMKIVC